MRFGTWTPEVSPGSKYTLEKYTYNMKVLSGLECIRIRFCEWSNEPSTFMCVWEFLDQLSYCQILKKKCTWWSYLTATATWSISACEWTDNNISVLTNEFHINCRGHEIVSFQIDIFLPLNPNGEELSLLNQSTETEQVGIAVTLQTFIQKAFV
jgi:hypothetical protein